MLDKDGNKMWAKHYNRCKMCGTNEKPHRQEGYCVTCWGKVRYQREREKFRRYFREYNQRKKKERQ